MRMLHTVVHAHRVADLVHLKDLVAAQQHLPNANDGLSMHLGRPSSGKVTGLNNTLAVCHCSVHLRLEPRHERLDEAVVALGEHGHLADEVLVDVKVKGYR